MACYRLLSPLHFKAQLYVFLLATFGYFTISPPTVLVEKNMEILHLECISVVTYAKQWQHVIALLWTSFS